MDDQYQRCQIRMYCDWPTSKRYRGRRVVKPIRIIRHCTSSLGLKKELLLHYYLRHFQPCSSQRYLWSWWKPRWNRQIQDRYQVLYWSIWKIRYDSNPLRQCSRLVLHKLCGRCTPWCHCTNHFKEKDPLGNCRRNSIHHCPLLLPIQIHLKPQFSLQ